jgi:6-phosphogluconolactonase
MTLPHFIGSLLTTALLANSPAAAGQLLYLASIKDKNIVAYAVNTETGELKENFRIDLPGNPGPLAFSPDASFVYAAVTGLDDNKAGVATLKRAENGSLTLVSTAHMTSRAPYIRADKTGRFLLAAHYGAGDVTVYRIRDGVFTGELLDQRATAQTAHCIEIDPSGRFVFVPHTSPNKVFQFRLNRKTGKLVPNDPATVDGPDVDHKYHAPRHYAHHPKLNVAYTSNESGGGITAWTFNPKSGTLGRLQTLSTLPTDYEGNSAAADIQLTPDGRFAYVSNRDVTKRNKGESMRDSLAAVSLDPKTGKMKIIGTFPTAHMPRSFCIDLSGQFLYSAGQGSATIVAYRIDRESGRLQQLATYETGGVPIWVMCGNVKQ